MAPLETYSELPEPLWNKRLAVEYRLMQERDPPLFDIVDGDLTHYTGVIVGSGYYEGGYFKVEIKIPRAYPYVPPNVIWHTRVWHPNFTDEVPARICESIFKDDWRPGLYLVNIVEALQNLLANPNPDDPLNSIAAYEMKYRPDVFFNRVRYYIQLYATPEKVFEKKLKWRM
ncbi:MAG: ubiquitin-conjugating enzyme E2 [Thaumarchaeota archaeon]|nr:ubiquitin-conjugating enzyme E2 [Candidatus Terraquivivens yellowstonensis]MCL7387116.1 ubiquitin-conjugating enzyme E2 [Candidatus Terraquivivens yellowstonensis]MCL7392412.1 ubiquitin-conjugating enzyme E2 [Candidatus Terraquivivens yellowstonensis]MCL7394909.1 ubiquitin-conjugating enzyme E2 [Candidatus Terraquivivens yellowstonensis]MCL7397880.1 ubiquitin-conjugating enzyme E2 [Candidatus Terraquivivens yellowstonensis]